MHERTINGKKFFFRLFRNCLNCNSLRWSHIHFICIPAVHIISFCVVDLRKSAKKVIFPKEIFLGPTNPYDISIFVLWAFISLFLKSAPQNLMNLKGDPKFIFCLFPVSIAMEGNKRPFLPFFTRPKRPNSL